MPVLVDPKNCVDRDHCFAASACPYNAFYHNPLKRTWEVESTICGDCPGPCLNFCDKDALRWGDDLVDLKLVKAALDGKMKPEEIAEARLKHKQELKAAKEAEDAAKKATEGVIALHLQNFEREVLRSQVPVVVDCWADWCGPCKQFSPIFEATAKQYVGIVKFAKLDADKEQALAQGLGVTALPTLLMFYRGQLVNVAEGALPASQFQGWIYQTLAAVRQHEGQLRAEEDAAITAAVQNLPSLGGPIGPTKQTPTSSPAPSSSDSMNHPNPLPNSNEQSHPSNTPELPGKRTASGLYIP